jgi:hypothetical protein
MEQQVNIQVWYNGKDEVVPVVEPDKYYRLRICPPTETQPLFGVQVFVAGVFRTEVPCDQVIRFTWPMYADGEATYVNFSFLAAPSNILRRINQHRQGDCDYFVRIKVSLDLQTNGAVDVGFRRNNKRKGTVPKRPKYPYMTDYSISHEDGIQQQNQIATYAGMMTSTGQANIGGDGGSYQAASSNSTIESISMFPLSPSDITAPSTAIEQCTIDIGRFDITDTATVIEQCTIEGYVYLENPIRFTISTTKEIRSTEAVFLLSDNQYIEKNVVRTGNNLDMTSPRIGQDQVARLIIIINQVPYAKVFSYTFKPFK